MDFSDKKNIGQEYKGFVIVDIEDIPDHKSKAVYLRHKTTGLEVYHLINDDRENLFSFCFRTVARNSKGAAHITEHSVLCGSEKFPLKEPFNTLDQQSLKTFLNALTYPEKTLYPAASVVKSDYYNLMDVYADAVFFPKLSRQTFMQEGWRVELDEKGKASIQGVVYNEMKANYSNFTQIAIDKMLSNMYPQSIYDYDSGGDPLIIPTLTYEEFIAFHKKFYSPSNCLLFLYGNIPTSEQLDFINEKYISRLEAAYGKVQNLDLNSRIPYVDEEIQKIQSHKRIEKTVEVHEIAPDNGATGNMVAVGYYVGKNNIDQNFLAEILSGNDSSPLTKKLKGSKLGEDESPLNGNFNYVQDDCIFCYGLSGVKKGNEEKVYDLVEKSIQEIYDEGISQKQIESAIMSIDFVLREQNRNFGPPSISIMSRAAASWSIGDKPSALLNRVSDFEKVKAELRKDPDYVKSLIKKYFLDAKVCLKFCAEPSKKYFAQRNKIENANLKAFEKNIDKVQLKKELEELHAYQGKLETEEELKCIPHLKLSDLTTDVEKIVTEYSTVKGCDGNPVPVLSNVQNTNGIIYSDICFPIDNLPPEKLPYLVLFSEIVGNLGWGGKNWSESTEEEAVTFGDLGMKISVVSPHSSSIAKQNIAKYPDQNVANRSYLIFSSKFLSEKMAKAFEVTSRIITTSTFCDEEHMAVLLSEHMNEVKENFVGSAIKYLSLSTRKNLNKSGAVKELLYGVSNLMEELKLSKKSIPSLLKEFDQMFREIKNQGAVIHIICDREDLQKVKEILPDFAQQAKLTKLLPAVKYQTEDYQKHFYKIPDYDPKKTDYIQAPCQAGYSYFTSKASGELTIQVYAEAVLSNYLSSHQLWEKIRMQGGAYGGRCAVNDSEGYFNAVSFRDPNPEKSLSIFIDSLKEAVEHNFTKEDIERCILSEYSEFIVPDSPCGYGNRGFNRYITGFTNEMYKMQLELLLKVTPEDVHQAAINLYNNALAFHTSAVFCDNSVKCCGNIIKIPL